MMMMMKIVVGRSATSQIRRTDEKATGRLHRDIWTELTWTIQRETLCLQRVSGPCVQFSSVQLVRCQRALTL